MGQIAVVVGSGWSSSGFEIKGPALNTITVMVPNRRDLNMLYTNFSVIKARNSPNLGYLEAKITFSNLQVMGVVLTQGALLEFDGINFSIDSSNFANVVLNASGTDLLRVLYSNQSQFQGELINLTFNGIIASDSSSAIHLLPTVSSSLGEGSRRLSSEGGSIINITDSQFFKIS